MCKCDDAGKKRRDGERRKGEEEKGREEEEAANGGRKEGRKEGPSLKDLFFQAWKSPMSKNSFFCISAFFKIKFNLQFFSRIIVMYATSVQTCEIVEIPSRVWASSLLLSFWLVPPPWVKAHTAEPPRENTNWIFPSSQHRSFGPTIASGETKNIFLFFSSIFFQSLSYV